MNRKSEISFTRINNFGDIRRHIATKISYHAYNDKQNVICRL